MFNYSTNNLKGCGRGSCDPSNATTAVRGPYESLRALGFRVWGLGFISHEVNSLSSLGLETNMDSKYAWGLNTYQYDFRVY